MAIIPALDPDIVRELLQNAQLPSADIGHNPRARFYLIEQAGQPVGLAGLECYGHDALLRSLLVQPAYRGRGLAAQLVDHIQQMAAAQGASALYLLTTDAADYFRRIGFRDIAREAAPPAIRQTEQFSQLCPAAASLLWRPIQPVSAGDYSLR